MARERRVVATPVDRAQIAARPVEPAKAKDPSGDIVARSPAHDEIFCVALHSTALILGRNLAGLVDPSVEVRKRRRRADENHARATSRQSLQDAARAFDVDLSAILLATGGEAHDDVTRIAQQGVRTRVGGHDVERCDADMGRLRPLGPFTPPGRGGDGPGPATAKLTAEKAGSDDGEMRTRRGRHALEYRGCIRRGLHHPVSCAPMVDRTDRHFRAMLRRICRHTLLYTEMVPVVREPFSDALQREVRDGPVAIQIGGTDPRTLARAASRAASLGYAEVNLNCGCPSVAAQHGGYGARMMAEPARVGDLVAAMRAATRLPVTVKHRFGIDGRDTFEDLLAFVDAVTEAGADRCIVHARVARLRGLSPHGNRTVPPLRIPEVYALKHQRPGVRLDINGGVTSLDAVAEHLNVVDGVMIGRALYDDPWMLADVGSRFYGERLPATSFEDVVAWALAYAAQECGAGASLHAVTRHWVGLVHGRPGARRFRQVLSTEATGPGAGPEVLQRAFAAVVSGDTGEFA